MDLGGAHTHHHSLLAGVGAGAMAVLVFGPLLTLLLWHRIAGTLGVAFTVAIVAVTVLLVAACAVGVLWLAVRARAMVRPVAPVQVVTAPLGEPGHAEIPREQMPAIDAPVASPFDWPQQAAKWDANR
jgi:hypothetical protein